MNSLVWGGADYAMTQPWGCTDVTEEPYWRQAQCHWHCGIDIGMNTGTALFAARAGTVAYVGYGLLKIAVGSQSDWYVHIDRSVVSVGATITQGQLVAYSGAKVPAGGYLTGPHLHFEVQTGLLNNPATSVDPQPILQPTAGAGQGEDDMFSDSDRKFLSDIRYAQTAALGSDATGVATGTHPGAVPITMPSLLTAIKAIQSPPPATVDLKPVLDAIAALKLEVDAIKARTDKDLAP